MLKRALIVFAALVALYSLNAYGKEEKQEEAISEKGKSGVGPGEMVGIPDGEFIIGTDSKETTDVPKSPVINRQQLREVWQQADWRKVIEVFQLNIDRQRRSRDDEIWLRSPFTNEQRASMHVSLSDNVYKDFSSGKGGGIIQFYREMLHQQGREMSMFETAEWMVSHRMHFSPLQ
jgi:hypothetical protein